MEFLKILATVITVVFAILPCFTARDFFSEKIRLREDFILAISAFIVIVAVWS